MSNARAIVEEMLRHADVRINGRRPFDIRVKDDRFYRRVLADRELGLGESYMDGWWNVQRLDMLVERMVSAGLREKLRLSPKLVGTVVKSTVLNRQTTIRARRNASYHYDVGNDLYGYMLGKRMMYTCAYWKDAKSLDAAQEAKLDLICKKLNLQPGMTLLDIGCGWGGFASYAAEKYQVHVVGITPAAEQVSLAKKRIMDPLVEFRQQDYREVNGVYDRVVSIGMLEHVGQKNFRRFFAHCADMLKEDGIMLHQTIGSNRSAKSIDPWADKYIFPGGVIPSLAQISKAVETRLVIEDVHNFGPDYDRTLMAWHANFVKNYPKLKNTYDEKFYRMWEFYLLSSAGLFRARRLQLYQVVMRKPVTSPTYLALR